MIIKKYGITLVRLKKQHLELVREKRNLNYIQDKMIYQKKISWWQQRKWFRSINNKNNFYFLIQHNHKFIGLINGKDIDLKKRTCEGGIFIWDKDYWNTAIPATASLILNDFNFFLANFKINYAKVLIENKNALQYNLKQGYEILSHKNNFIILELTKEYYIKNSLKIRTILSKINNDFQPLSPEDISFADDSNSEMKKLYTNLPEDIQNLVNEIKKVNPKNA